jgi:hypothetical protein
MQPDSRTMHQSGGACRGPIHPARQGTDRGPSPGNIATRQLGQPVWLPGHIEVQVAGESFHQEAIHAVEVRSPPGSPLVAALVPDPGNAHDSNAVAAYPPI